MTTSRLFPATNGPSSPTAYAGPFTAGITFRCIGPRIQWLQAIGIWVPPGGDTSPVGGYTTQLWQALTSTTGSLIAGTSATTSKPLIAGQWNFIPLATPVPLSLDTPYTAGVGWASVNGFPDTPNQFGAAQPFAGGITSGDLFAYSDQGASAAIPTGAPQGGFTVSTPPPQFPDSSSNSSNFWVDVLVSDTAPAAYTGTYQLYPNNVNGNLSAVLDLDVNYNVGTEFALSAACPLEAASFLSLPTAASLPTRVSVWSVGTLIRTEIPATVLAAPAWSGAAGSGWVTASYASPPVLPAGKYVIAAFNANGTSGGWNAKDSITGAFGSGNYSAGISNGPLSAPGLAAASLCYDYSAADGANTPPFAIGTTEPGQCPFGQLPGGGLGQPYLYAGAASGSLPQNYFVSPVVGQPVPVVAGYLPDGDTSRLIRKPWLF